MQLVAASVVIGLVIVPTSWAQTHEHCPMAPSKAHREAVDQRHDASTGVGHEASLHHFVLAEDGGSIQLEASDPTDVASRDGIREHLQAIARAFAAGDFSMPKHIHDELPPGAEVMAARRSAIRYSYQPTNRGGVVRISTTDKTAREAIQRFLRFQISDHGTGDPTE